MPEPVYPNLFVIGAAKSGTSSLHYYLSLHPEIHMSVEKEPHYFSRLAGSPEEHLPRYSDAEYQALFDSPLPVRGESSVTYSFWPQPTGIPELIHERAPDARFVYLVRDPVERAFAQYNHRVALGVESRSLDEVVAQADPATEQCLAASSYATQLEQYRRCFPSDRFMVIEHLDLLEQRQATLRKVFAFLGVDPAFDSPRFEATVNESRHDRRFSPIGQRLRTSTAYRRATGWMRPDTRQRIVAPLRLALSRPPERTEPSDAQRAAWAAILRPEAERLRAMTGERFARWSV